MSECWPRSAMLGASIILAPTLLSRPAYAFACYIGEPPGGPVLLHQRPDSKSPVIMHLESGFMLSDVSRVRQRNGWVFVRWSKEQLSQKEFVRGSGDGKGWMKVEQVFCECED